jgi:hypothetical protein
MLILLAAIAVTAPSAFAATASSLRIVALQPITVRGAGFRAHERVTLRLTVNGDSHLRNVRATSRGRFVTTFATATIPPCSTWRLTARGNLGSRATLRPKATVDCAAP